MPLAKAIESEWALSDGATVIPDAYLDSKTASSILTAQAFKSYYESKNAPAPYSKEIMLDFLTSKTVKMVHVQNYQNSEGSSERIGRSAFYISDNPWSTN